MSLTETDLIVEDGTGIADANTYSSLAAATSYHALRGNDVWADADENDQVVALVRATQYVDERWTFLSIIFNDDPAQALQFPRYEMYDRNGADVSETVPVEITQATQEYALQVLGDGTALINLSPTPTQTSGDAITYNREKVGSLETEVRFDTSKGLRVTMTYPTADRIILRSGFTRTTGGGVIR